jgi:hypothetical protein
MFLTVVLMALPHITYADDSALLSKSQALTAEYATQLQSALQEAMSTGGPVAAITVCKDLAPAIQSELSRQSGANVRRTSLKFRNSGNAPDDWETEVLETFANSDQKEVFETTASGAIRYMKAIPTGAVCLACHGKKLAPEIGESLRAAYPHDRALGYSLGDIRGAFSITWPAPALE